MKKIAILQDFWFKKRKIVLRFPDGWKVEDCLMAADKWKELSLTGIEKAINNPIGCKRLEVLAKGKKEAVILVDDMTRPTRPYKIIPYILQKLRSAGLKREGIRFIVASGSHGPCNSEDFRKKLGRDVVADYPIYNHNSFENCTYVGKTTGGMPLYLNKEFMFCDLKIGIGSVLPHIYCGFSGGGKIVLPGIGHIRTIDKFHSQQTNISGFGKEENNPCIKSFNEASELSGFQFKIDFIVNTDGNEVACFAGDPAKAFKKAVKTAKRAYLTNHKASYDVIIANACLKSNEADLAIHNCISLLNPKGGIFILVTHNPQGQINHYLLRSFGKFIGGRRYRRSAVLRQQAKYIIFSPYKECNAFDTFDKPESLIWKGSWNSILKIISKGFSNPKIGVFKDATIQLLSKS